VPVHIHIDNDLAPIIWAKCCDRIMVKKVVVKFEGVNPPVVFAETAVRVQIVKDAKASKK
jgi:hypothetical protein